MRMIIIIYMRRMIIIICMRRMIIIIICMRRMNMRRRMIWGKLSMGSPYASRSPPSPADFSSQKSCTVVKFVLQSSIHALQSSVWTALQSSQVCIVIKYALKSSTNCTLVKYGMHFWLNFITLQCNTWHCSVIQCVLYTWKFKVLCTSYSSVYSV